MLEGNDGLFLSLFSALLYFCYMAVEKEEE
jgi:hypothetical protein